ncbi:hypothetical protein E1180_08780 [Roseibium denhamense]|nr:autotransporter domain-containing protein [Roseibium denhamense]MTI05611.1 hypothetical protein [Roseibium denhamense]
MRPAHRSTHLLSALTAAAIVTHASAASADTAITTFGTDLTTAGETGTVAAGETLSGVDDDGVFMGADNQTVINNGTINLQTTGVTSYGGVGTLSDNSTVENNGTITTSGEEAFGIVGGGDNFIVTNSGTISTTGEEGFGIFALGDGNTLINTGSIITTGEESRAFFSFGDADQISNTGTISTSGEDAQGIFSTGDNAIIENSGSITTQGEDSFGIFSAGDSSTITNTNSITTNGIDAIAIFSVGDASNVTNSGTLTTSGDGSHGISVEGSGSTVTQSGTITTSGPNAHGIESDQDGITIVNSGKINVTGDNSDGIDVDGIGTVVINSGTITSLDADGNGIDVNGANALVTNSGTISVSGPDGVGIDITGNDAVIVNSGTVLSTSGPSINLNGSNMSVTLTEGSVLQGLINFTDPSTASFSYDTGRTGIFSFGSLPGTVSTNGLSSWTSGNTLTIVDPDDFKQQSLAPIVTETTRTSADLIDQRLDTAHTAGFDATATYSGTLDTISPVTGLTFWGDSYGGVVSRSGEDGFDHVYGGIIGGVETVLPTTWTAGLVAGSWLGSTETDDDVTSATQYSFYGGGYVGKSWQDMFANLSVTGGYVASDEDITILNNSVSGGLQTLSMTTDHLFVAPSARLGSTIATVGGILTPSLRARYVGLWQLGTAEESVTRYESDGRSLHVLELGGQAKFAFAPVEHESGALTVSLLAGADGVFTLSDTADASVNGTNINLSLDEDTLVRGFAGAEAAWDLNNGARFVAGVQGGYDSAETFSGTVRLGFKTRF